MSEIIEKFKYLVDKSVYYQKLKDDKNYLFKEIVKIDKNDIESIKLSYEQGKIEKIKKIRYEVCNLLLDDKFDKESYEKLKKIINSQYKTNILQSWKDYSILYILFFNPIKDKVNNYLEDIGTYLLDKS